jgi:hypothetical protein
VVAPLKDNANRSFLIYLDETENQDQRIMQYQRLLVAGKVNTEDQHQIKQLLQNTQRVLKSVKIINPYAEYLQLPKEVFKPRRTNAHYLGFIEAITFYHQYQRQQQVDEETGEIYINTTIEDIEEANKLIKEILLRKSDELSGACRNYFEQLKAVLVEAKKTTFTNYEIRTALRENHSNQKRFMIQLLRGMFVKKQDDKTKSKTHTYEIVSNEEYKQLQNRISNVLDEILVKLKTVHQSNQVQLKNKPSNTSKIKEKKKSSPSSQGGNADLNKKDDTDTPNQE